MGTSSIAKHSKFGMYETIVLTDKYFKKTYKEYLNGKVGTLYIHTLLVRLARRRCENE